MLQNYPGFSVIVCAYEEQANIANVVRCLLGDVGKALPLKEVLVVDDGSQDRTSQLAEKSGATVIKLENNAGKARAFSKGLKALLRQEDCPKYILTLDADIEYIKPKQIVKLITPLRVGKSMTVGSAGNTEGMVSSYSGQRGFRTSGLRQMMESAYGHVLAGSNGRVGYGLEVMLNGFFSGKDTLDHVVLGNKDVTKVPTNFELTSDLQSRKIEHRVTQIPEVDFSINLLSKMPARESSLSK